MGALIDKALWFTLTQRKNELEKAITRAPDSSATKVREEELEYINQKLEDMSNAKSWRWRYLLLSRSLSRGSEAMVMWFSFVHRYYE